MTAVGTIAEGLERAIRTDSVAGAINLRMAITERRQTETTVRRILVVDDNRNAAAEFPSVESVR